MQRFHITVCVVYQLGILGPGMWENQQAQERTISFMARR